jgi:hypothetical protein
MSEFTDGLLVLKEHAPLVQAALANLEKPHIYQDLDEKWSAIFIDNVNIHYNPDDPARLWALKHSTDFPMLYFQHSEDHGWGYNLFHEGREKASLDVNYSIPEGSMLELAEKIYPGVDPYGELSFEIHDSLYSQVYASESYRQEIEAQYVNIRPEEFAVLGLSADDIVQLRDVLTAKRYEERIDNVSQVEAFQKVLGIEAVSWVSYHYLSREDNEDDFDE